MNGSRPTAPPALPSDRIARRMIGLAAALTLLHAWTYLGVGPIDDDFICYRYARNFVAGHGLVYNPGELFEGYTTPGWTLLVAMLIRLGFDPVVHAHTVGILGAVVAVLAVGDAWRTRFPAARWVPPVWILAASPVLAFHANAGLGTTLLAALLAITWAAWERSERRGVAPLWAASWLGVAILVRQECVLFVLPLAVAELRAGRGREIFTASLLGLGWTIYRWITYGRLLPITYGVKKLPVLDDLGYGARYLVDVTLLTGFVVFVALAWLSVRRIRRGEAARHRSAPVVALTAGVTLHALYVVWVGGDFVPWARFVVPTLPLAVGLGCVGLARIGPWRATAAVVVAMTALQWPSLVPLENRSAVGLRHRFADQVVQEDHWAAIGRWMRTAAPEGTRLATSPIGVLGWTSELEVIDILGLTHDGALDVPPDLEGVGMKGHHRSATAYVLERAPEWVLLGNGWNDAHGVPQVNPWERELVLHPDFGRRYRQVTVRAEGVEPFDLFVHRDAPLPPEATPR